MKLNIMITIAIILAGAMIAFGIYATKEAKIEEDLTAQAYKEAFMGGCIQEGGTYESCNCYYNGLLSKFGKEGLLEKSSEYLETNILPDGFVEVILSCI